MVSMMDLEPKNEICDSRPGLVQSAISHRAVDLDILTTPVASPVDCELAKRVLKLQLQHSRVEKCSIDDDEKSFSLDLKSPKSPLSNSSKSGGRNSNMSHQTSITSQVDVIVEDRKALRDALYQGIFHRHRRTIFAVGSFLRMLRTRNSQYNTIRSSSEGDDDTR